MPPEEVEPGNASSAKAAAGDASVFAYIAGLPPPQRSIVERIDALAAEELPHLQRTVKWGMAYYGVGGGCRDAFFGGRKLSIAR